MRSLCLRVAQFICGLLLTGSVLAQDYPNRPVKLVVPFPAGSQTDQVARLLSVTLQNELRQPFVVENKPGAAGAIAAQMVARSPADGYTLLVTTAAIQAANVSLFKKLSYDPIKDFTPISRLSTTSMMLVVRPDFPANNLQEFLAHIKRQPGGITGGYGSPGAQIALAMLKSKANLDVIEVPYKGIPPAMTDVLGGTLNFTFADVGNAAPQIKAGKLRGIAVTSRDRQDFAPDIQSFGEQFPGMEVVSWYGIMAPANTSKELANRLNTTIAKILSQPDVRAKFLAIGTTPSTQGPDEFDQFIRAEIRNWANLAKLANIAPE